MKQLVRSSLFSAFFLLTPWVFAQNSGQSSSDSGVLVSPPFGQGTDQNSTGNSGTGSGASANTSGNSSSSGQHKHQHANGDSDASSQDSSGNSSNNNTGKTSPTDEVVVKAANAIVFEMTSNLKLSQDQISAVGPIVADNIAQVRDLQKSLEDGTIDGSTMYAQRQELNNEEIEKLSSILTSDQMKVWIGIQNQPARKNNGG